MRTLAIAVLALACIGTAACADDSVTYDQAKSIQDALNALDCLGGDMETETGDGAAFEVDEAVCKDGQYDFKLDKDFNVISQKKK